MKVVGMSKTVTKPTLAVYQQANDPAWYSSQDQHGPDQVEFWAEMTWIHGRSSNEISVSWGMPLS